MTAKCLCNLKQQQVGKSSLNYSPARKPVDFCSNMKPELPHKRCLNGIYKSHYSAFQNLNNTQPTYLPHPFIFNDPDITFIKT